MIIVSSKFSLYSITPAQVNSGMFLSRKNSLIMPIKLIVFEHSQSFGYKI